MANHSRWCDSNPKSKSYKDAATKRIKNIDAMNTFQGNQFTIAKEKGEEYKFSKETLDKMSLAGTGRKHSEETKKRLSEIRKNYLRENPDKHVWKRNDKFKSGPCEHLKEVLKERNIEFVEEFTPLIDRMFSIDIAIPDKKIAIEVNGQQHYNGSELAPYYQERHDLIEAEGWTIHEIHYSKVYSIHFRNARKRHRISRSFSWKYFNS